MLDWADDGHLRVDGTDFRLAPMTKIQSSPKRFLLCKTRPMVETYASLIAELAPRNIVELGIFRGGSTALLASMAQPAKLVAVELGSEPVEALATFIERKGLQDSVKTYYGVDQADREAIERILDQEYQGQPLDLVIDDASHFLDESRRSFNFLFPRLRPGGVYAIEDWQWAHGSLEGHDGRGLWPEKPPLTILLFQLMMACPSVPSLITDVSVNSTIARVTRGPAEVDPATFDIEDCYGQRGRDLVAGL